MNKHLITAAVLGLLTGATNRSEADTLYDACQKPLATGGTVILAQDRKTFTYTTCDKQVTRTYSVVDFTYERGKVCPKRHTPNVSCKGEFSRGPAGDPPDPKSYVPSCLVKTKK